MATVNPRPGSARGRWDHPQQSHQQLSLEHRINLNNGPAGNDDPDQVLIGQVSHGEITAVSPDLSR